ncbi:hypothetical protein EUZ87_17110 [Lactiplantibacillus paraplantarum]|uniref:Uncharacterized protein n=1 Tax=Lactiplantibacillus paraplantarum TaxID=60520 RepID=A0A4V2L1D3_9LACO|nr:hypothetical protein EUZ87_17110 [Lactiplantibacillus paraplantarum]
MFKGLEPKICVTNGTKLSGRSSGVRAAYRNVFRAAEACACYATESMPKTAFIRWLGNARLQPAAFHTLV